MAPQTTNSNTGVQAPQPVQLRDMHANPTTATSLQTAQPSASQPMDPQAPHPPSTEQLGLRGGRSEMCPGRFCFCIPCPIPCDFCII